MQSIRELLTRLGVMAAHPGAFGILIVYTLLWLIFDLDFLRLACFGNSDCLVHDSADPTRRASRHSGTTGEAR